MKLALFFAALGTSTALKCTAKRGPRPDYQETESLVEATTEDPTWRAATTEYPIDPNGEPPRPPSNEDCTCGIEDFNDASVSSWRTNCPSGCAIYQYLDEVDDKLNDDWNQLEVRFACLLHFLKIKTIKNKCTIACWCWRRSPFDPQPNSGEDQAGT